VAVTGATGFIGQALIAALVRDKRQVLALTRDPRPDSEYVKWLTGTLEDTQVLERLVSGVSAIVHCAGRVRGRTLEEFLRTNVQGTAGLVQASSRQHPLPRLLLISSLAAREPQLSWYARSKYFGEQRLIEHAGEMAWTVFRPAAVYGPGDRELSPLFRATRYGMLPMTGSPSSRFGLLHVDDLVAAILSWLDADIPPRGVYELDDGTPGGYDRQSVATIAGQVWGRPVTILPIPAALVRLLAGINLGLARLFRYSPMLTPGKVRELLHNDWVSDNLPLTVALGWRPKAHLCDALPAAILPADKTLSRRINP
jgi:nucleoside-diphosphate-sugar epimerase